MSTYFIAPHVYHCATDGQVVLLDLKNDRYVGLGNAEARSLSGLIAGWPDSLERFPGSDSALPVDTSALVRAMMQKGLITNEAQGEDRLLGAKNLRPAARSVPPIGPVRLSARHIANFINATTTAAVSLRLRRLDRVVMKVATRKACRSMTDRSIAETSHLVAMFNALRPFAFTAKDACLFDSLALLEFLSKYRVFPTWVIGVLAAPFAAHSWLQLDDVVLNDHPEHVLRYMPILTI